MPAGSGGQRTEMRTVQRRLWPRNFWISGRRRLPIHFRKEEEVLLPVMARYGEDLSRELLVEMLEEHAHIRGLLMRLSDEVWWKCSVRDSP